MKVTEAKYARRFKLEEYEWEEHQLTAIVDTDESGSEVLSELKAEVNRAFTGEAAAPEAQETKKAPKAKKEKKEKKNAKSKSSAADDEDEDAEDSEGSNGDADDEGSEDDEGSDADSEDDGDGESEDTEEESEEGAEEDSKPAKGKAAKGKKGFVKKPQVYDRKIEQHKEIFSKVLRSIAPDWKKTEAGKVKAKKVSATIEGSKFLDETGEVVDSFKKTLKTLWSSTKK